MAKAFVTGGTGFIGRRLVRALAERGDDVTCLVRVSAFPRHVAELRQYGAKLVEGELHGFPDILPMHAGVEVVYHLAGATRARNLLGFLNVNARVYDWLTVLSRHETPPAVVFVSSLAAGGPAPSGQLRAETDAPSPISNYGMSKLVAELLARSYADKVPITIVRPPMVLGPGDSVSVDLFRILRRVPVHLIPGLRRHQYSLVFADELVQGLIAAAQRGERLPVERARHFDWWHSEMTLQEIARKIRFDETWNDTGCTHAGQGIYYLASDRLITYEDLGRLVAEAAGRRRILALPVPSPIVWCMATLNEIAARARRQSAFFGWDKCREATAGDWTCSAAKAREQLGFRTNDDFSAQIRATYEWFCENGWL